MQKNSLSLVEQIITSPLLRWTWSGLSAPDYIFPIAEFRPCDKEAAKDMSLGRYLLASKLVDSKSHSPFSIDEADEQWKQRLNDFSWLRHFTQSTEPREREFARVLVLDWIGRNAKFNQHSWSPIITSLRVLNWLRHINLLKEGASEKQIKIISGSLSTQAQSLKIRIKFMRDPIDIIFSAMALLGSDLAKRSSSKSIIAHLMELQSLLNKQIDADGLHLSRNSLLQFILLSELVSLKQTLGQVNDINSNEKEKFANTLKSMHSALDSLTHGHGEIAYFNGAKSLPADIFVALQANSPREKKLNQTIGGYGILVSGSSTLIADGGVVPDIRYSRYAHASALAFEFSFGSDLLLGNCGTPLAVQKMTKSEIEYYNYFRLGQAHNGPVINKTSSAIIQKTGTFANHLKKPNNPIYDIIIEENVTEQNEVSMFLTSSNFEKSHGIKLRREFFLLDGGETLIGVDKIIISNKRQVQKQPQDLLELAFHLAPSAILSKGESEGAFFIQLKSGAKWTFLWEGAEAHIESSLRHSGNFGPLPTTKIVLKSAISQMRNATQAKEISWIFTRQ